MTLRDIASVAGKPGLYKVIKPTRSGVILETIDSKKQKLVAGANSRVSILKEISIYTTGPESSILLEEVFKLMYTKYNSELPVTSKSSEDELSDFLLDILSNYDEERVYLSDIKKLVTWYNTLTANSPELFENLLKEEKPEEKTESKEAE